MGFKKRVDLNQKRVTKELRELGYSVALTHVVGDGFPDFVVGMLGVNMLVELKSPGGKCTPKEVEFLGSFRGFATVCYSTEEIVGAFDRYLDALDNGIYGKRGDEGE